MKAIIRIYQFITTLLCILYTVGYLTWRLLLISPLYDGSWQLQVSEVFWAWSYLPLVPLLFLVLLSQKWQRLLILGIPILLFSWEYGSRFLPNWQHGFTLPAAYAQSSPQAQNSLSETDPDNDQLQVMTWNSFRSHRVNEELQKLLVEERPDIITIQEVGSGLRRALNNEFKDIYPYQYHQSYGSLATISRYPLSPPTHDRLFQMGCRCLPLELNWRGQTLTVINIHIPRPAVFYNVSKGIPRVTTFDPRSQELHYKVLFKLLDEIETPVLLQGDMNTTEQQPNFRKLSKTLKDSFAEAGWGMGFTYPHVSRSAPRWLIPLVQIDHIMHSEELVALSAHADGLQGSDHLYVMATVRWR